MKPGTKVEVNLGRGCPCGCGRVGSYTGVIVQGDDKFHGILVQRPDGRKFYEYAQCVKVLP